MDTLERINNKLGQSTIKLAAQGINHNWKMRQDQAITHY